MSKRHARRKLKPRAHRHTPPGAKPGTLAIEPDARPTSIRVMAYSKDRLLEQEVRNPRELQSLLSQWPVIWVDVTGLGTESTLRTLAEIFRIHPLALEDIVNVHQRAKVEPYPDNVFCVLRVPDPTNEQLTEQFSLVLGRNYLVTFQERPGDCFDLVRNGIRLEQSAMRQGIQTDYLAYRLIDAAIDAYFPVLESIGDRLDDLDDHATNSFAEVPFADLHAVKRELLLLRRAVWPLRDAMAELSRESSSFVSDATRMYLRDCYDHAVQLIDLLESYRDIAGDVRDFFLSSISNRMNQVMKTLTVISTIFLPLGFIAGVYGMNFNPEASPWNMPELSWYFGYPYALLLMAFVAAAMLLNFKYRGWLSGDPSLRETAANSTPTPKVESATRPAPPENGVRK